MVPFSAEYRNILNDYLLRIASASMRDVTLVILNSLRIKCHIRRPLNSKRCMHHWYHAYCSALYFSSRRQYGNTIIFPKHRRLSFSKLKALSRPERPMHTRPLAAEDRERISKLSLILCATQRLGDSARFVLHWPTDTVMHGLTLDRGRLLATAVSVVHYLTLSYIYYNNTVRRH